MDRIPIFFAIDDNYAPCLSCALISARDHASPDKEYIVTVVHKDLKEESREKLSRIASDNFEIRFVEMKRTFETITDDPANRLNCSFFTLTIFFRIFIPEMFKDLDKGLYLDADIIVNDDLAKLFETDLEGKLFGGCTDLSVMHIPQIVRYYEQAVGVKADRYINSGVLLMDMKRLRELKLGESFLRLLNKYHFDSVAPDQDYINAMAKDNILYLDNRWDAMPSDKPLEISDPGVIHFNLFHKPWCVDGVQFSELFWKYAKKSEFYPEIRRFKDSYGADRIAADEEAMRLLIRRADFIPEKPVTFRKAALAGERIKLC